MKMTGDHDDLVRRVEFLERQVHEILHPPNLDGPCPDSLRSQIRYIWRAELPTDCTLRLGLEIRQELRLQSAASSADPDGETPDGHHPSTREVPEVPQPQDPRWG